MLKRKTCPRCSKPMHSDVADRVRLGDGACQCGSWHAVEEGASRGSPDRLNPKDLAGAAKIDLSLFPAAALAHAAHAMMDGAAKYGAYNWRERAVRSRVYVSAAMRHLEAFLDREDVASDSGVHHLGHAIACCAILLDAIETGNLADDRPVTGAASAVLARLNGVVLSRTAASAKRRARG